jgi:hypothetical protein
MTSVRVHRQEFAGRRTDGDEAAWRRPTYDRPTDRKRGGAAHAIMS